MKDLSNKNVIHKRKDKIEYLQFRKLLEYPEITHAYSLGLNRNYTVSNNIEENFQKSIKDYDDLTKAIGSKLKNVVKMNQAHTDEIKIITNKTNKKEPDFNLEKYNKTDGSITNKENIMLATTNADCILFLFYDSVKKVIANTHSGWRGTYQRIGTKTIDKMIQEFNCNPKDIIVCICPSIRKCHFEVEKEVKEMFEEEFKDINLNEDILEETIPNKKWHIDTVKINEILFLEKGLKQENIIDSNICSICNKDQIHSYRVEQQNYGLNTAVIELR